ncbi:MAG: hypothetical protein ACXWKX_05135 [Caulobacteraceae bacterium]
METRLGRGLALVRAERLEDEGRGNSRRDAEGGDEERDWHDVSKDRFVGKDQPLQWRHEPDRANTFMRLMNINEKDIPNYFLEFAFRCLPMTFYMK